MQCLNSFGLSSFGYLYSGFLVKSYQDQCYTALMFLEIHPRARFSTSDHFIRGLHGNSCLPHTNTFELEMQVSLRRVTSCLSNTSETCQAIVTLGFIT